MVGFAEKKITVELDTGMKLDSNGSVAISYGLTTSDSILRVYQPVIVSIPRVYRPVIVY